MPVIGTLPIYESTVVYSRGGQTFSNVIAFEATADPGSPVGSFRLNSALLADLEPHILAFMSDQITIVEYNTRRLNNLFDFNTLASGNSGSKSGDILPTFNAARINKVRTNKETRGGWMKVPGVMEVDSNHGVLTATALVELGDIADEMDSGFNNGGSTFFGVIIGGKRPGGVPADEADWVWQNVFDYSEDPNVYPQNSRREF